MNTPNIRFKGYDDAWEQRKFPEFVQFYNGQTYKPEDVQDDGVLVLRSSNVKNDEIVDADNVYLDKSVANAEQVRKGDIIVVVRNGSRALIGKHAEIKREMSNTVIGAFMTGIRSEHSSFVNALLGTPQFEREIEMNMGATINQITGYMFSKMAFMIPSGDEQDKIGAYFKGLDDLIALHQRKCDDLQEVKKYMLQKLFPQNGAKIPEIRFEGFTGDWEQRKLGEVFEQTTNYVNPAEDEVELWSLTVEAGLTPKTERYNREFLVKKDDNFKEVRPGDIVYNPMNMTLGAVGYNGMAKSVAVSGYYTTMVAKDGYDSYYINTWLKSPQAILLYKNYATGTLIEKQRVQFPTLSTIPASFPEFEEQKQIGAYFANLDNLIALHQRKCDDLKEFKKFMLQNMFSED